MKTENKKTPLNERIANPKNRQLTREPRTEQLRQGFKVVGSAPTSAPRDYYESIVIYSSGSTYRLYVYDETAGAWRYASLT